MQRPNSNLLINLQKQNRRYSKQQIKERIYMIGENGIRIIYGDNPKQMVKELLEVIKPEEEIE